MKNMKKIAGWMLVALLMLAVFPMKAQVRIGIKTGVNVHSIHYGDDVFESGNVTGFYVGPMIEVPIPMSNATVDVALLYTRRRLETDELGEKGTLKTNYLDVPVNIKWHFGIPLIRMYFSAGPYASFRLGGDNEWNLVSSVAEQVEAKSFGAGLNFGAGLTLLRFWQIGVNYGLGLTDDYSVRRSSLSGVSAKNRGWSISTGIMF